PNLGSYWDERYGAAFPEPFDWLFPYAHVRDLIHECIPNKSASVLLLGCGNAPFGPDM
ncbi:unnamed protein product, partial [Phaeothamnion confervicola]